MNSRSQRAQSGPPLKGTVDGRLDDLAKLSVSAVYVSRGRSLSWPTASRRRSACVSHEAACHANVGEFRARTAVGPSARTARGVTLIRRDGPQRETGLDLFAKIRERAVDERFTSMALPIVDIHIARENARLGDRDGAIDLARTVVDDLLSSGGCIWTAVATTVLVEPLLQSGGGQDVEDAQAAVDRLVAVPTDPGFVLHELALLRLRALLARAHGDETGYRDYRDRYRAMATSLGFEGHIAMAKAMA
jgi:hypothetical protein